MRATTVFAVAMVLLLTSSRGSTAQTLEDEADAMLALGRAGALLTFEKDGGARVTLSGIKNAERLLDHVKVLSNVMALDLAGTDVNDTTLEKVGGLTTLRSLNLAATKVEDNGLRRLKGLTNLTVLSLFGTQVSDKGLSHLKALKTLKIVIVNKTKVTAAGATDLMEAVPKVSVRGIEEWKTGYARVEMEGKLWKETVDKKETWFIQVKTSLAGEITWPLEFVPSKEMQETAQRLEKKTVIITGEIVRESHFPGVGGESFLIPPPEPKVVVRTLRAAD